MKNYYNYDELTIYRGGNIYINDKIIITQPTIGQIQEFGESRYFSAVYTFVSVGADLKWQLHKNGVDYTTIKDYDLFINYISQAVSSRKNILNYLKDNYSKSDECAKILDELSEEDKIDMEINPMQLLLKDIDFGDFVACTDTRINEPVLYNQDKDITIDRTVYTRMVDIIRRMHGFKRNNQMPANETTKRDLIEDARDEYLANKNKPFKSILMPYISAIINHPYSSYKHGDIWDMGINAFFDSIRRIEKIQNSTLLLQGAYSGFASLKGVSKESLNWHGNIEI